MKPDHRPRKRFGQNFLVDGNVTQRIVRAIQPKRGDNLVEIGPGQGALTTHLLSALEHLTVVEIDRDLIALLQQQFEPERLTIHQADALKFDFGKLATADTLLRIVGNLPYNISTPLIFHLLEFRGVVKDMLFLLQKEVVDRMTASPGQKQYGRLSVMLQFHCQVEALFNVANTAFRPVPKVQSSIVKLTPYVTSPYPACDHQALSQLVNLCFQQRRKTLRNCLRPRFADKLETVPLDLSLRPEQLAVSDFVNLANLLDQHE